MLVSIKSASSVDKVINFLSRKDTDYVTIVNNSNANIFVDYGKPKQRILFSGYSCTFTTKPGIITLCNAKDYGNGSSVNVEKMDIITIL